MRVVSTSTQHSIRPGEYGIEKQFSEPKVCVVVALLVHGRYLLVRSPRMREHLEVGKFV